MAKSRKIHFFRRLVTSQLKVVRIDFFKEPRHIYVTIPVPQGLLFYDLSNTGKDFLHTLYIDIVIIKYTTPDREE
jgi:hypothetical protein